LKLSLSTEEVPRWVVHLLSGAFHDADPRNVDRVTILALDRLEHCFKNIALSSYSDERGAIFNHLHGDQTATFFYLCSNEAWKIGDMLLAGQFFLLNKMRNGFVCMYDTILPDIFLLNHTIGTMLGKAAYGDYFVAYHGVTVGTDRAIQPVIGKNVIMYPQSSVTGDCNVGDGAVFSAKATLMRMNVEADTIVSGIYPAIVKTPRRKDFVGRYFKITR